jgi:hypothetical protein
MQCRAEQHLGEGEVSLSLVVCRWRDLTQERGSLGGRLGDGLALRWSNCRGVDAGV